MSAKANKKFASHRKLFLVGKDAPFSFVEAYKSLRTNLEFLSTTGCLQQTCCTGGLRHA